MNAFVLVAAKGVYTAMTAILAYTFQDWATPLKTKTIWLMT